MPEDGLELEHDALMAEIASAASATSDTGLGVILVERREIMRGLRSV